MPDGCHTPSSLRATPSCKEGVFGSPSAREGVPQRGRGEGELGSPIYRWGVLSLLSQGVDLVDDVVVGFLHLAEDEDGNAQSDNASDNGAN